MNIAYTTEDKTNHTGVAAVIKNAQGEVLVQEHVKFGFWTIPVGKVKPGQDVVEGLQQEIREECGVEVREWRELARREYMYQRDGEEVAVDAILFEITRYEGEVQNLEPHKHAQQVFMSISDIARLPYVSDMTLLYLEQLGIRREAHI